ncbi:BofC C-terminal domain-containing protein [Brevibacillus fluminis]|uniref:BofC C-terminal domain-containing protein n=1 Tax=Brevibacillus fluminis TaxID=511487 RepID=UPI003F88A981
MKQRYSYLFVWSIALVMVTSGVTAYVMTNTKETMFSLPSLPQLLTGQKPAPGKAKVTELVLAHSYLCGSRDEERKPVLNDSIDKMLGDYAGWEIIGYQNGKLMLLKRENDISPLCKENGYFGINEEDILTLFNGMPKEKQVIQTYYPINTSRMEASLPKEEVEALKKGIRIRDLAEYNSVLSTFVHFQADGTVSGGH